MNVDTLTVSHVSTDVNMVWHSRFMQATALPVTGDLAACCAPVTGGALGARAAERLAHVFKALGDPTRLRLLSLIAAAEGGEACICDLTRPVALSQPTVSHHMKQLVDAGLVTREQRGRWVYYRVLDDALRAAAQAIEPQAQHAGHDSRSRVDCR
jgi:ArsR family transcriptional regulator, arsenate/arsenite/antimonite-responsive transcriptional repressor